MTLRTPRRRIAPRTKRRYRAIKDFLKRALGTPSEPKLKTNSSEQTIEISVSDLKQQIVGIEDQLKKVSKHCQDIAHLDKKIRQSAVYLTTHESSHKDLISEKLQNSKSDLKSIDTKVLYRTCASQFMRSDESDHRTITADHDIQKIMASQNYPFGPSNNEKTSRSKTKHRKHDQANKVKEWQSRHQSNEMYYGECQSTSSFHSVHEVGYKHFSKAGCSKHDKQYTKRDYIDPIILKEANDKNKTRREGEIIDKKCESRHRSRKKCREQSDLDQEFIANIIKRQYKPVQLFGRKESDFSQISAPVCRDHEFRIQEDVQQGSDLCSCCFDQRRRHGYQHVHNSDLSDMRSVCDARLYSSKKRNRYTCRREHLNDYNNSAYYDIIPVKEKSSPKSRRKFVEDNIPDHLRYKEVPPSPRTQRPRLNLKARPYDEFDNSYVSRRQRLPRLKQRYEIEESEDLSENIQMNVPETIGKNKLTPQMQKAIPSREDVGTMSSLQCPIICNENNNLSNNDTTLNTQTTDVSVDKTDKTLCEIKDILQSFLTELKKESTHSNKSNGSTKMDGKKSIDNQNQETNKLHSNSTQKSGHSFNNYGTGQCNVPPPFLAPFQNPCCYPMLPMCPVNCMQNGYVVPSPSLCTCSVCANLPKEPEKVPSSNKNNPSKETQELIREIYKFVSQNPKPTSKKEINLEDHGNLLRNQQSKVEKKLLTTRSTGGHSKVSKHDARVGTPATKCVSKSCEALGSPINSDTFYTNASYSDTILDKLSLEATQSSTESDVSSEASARKNKRNKFKTMLRSFGLWKKKKKDVIEELSEGESTVEANIKPRPPPFKQNIINYNMHGQEFFHSPPIPQQNYHTTPPPHLPHRHSPQSYPPYAFDPRLSPNDLYNQQGHDHHHYPAQAHRHGVPQHHAIPNPNDHPHYNQMPPQVPLCLKEIEVKSIGTQSERKVSILNKFAKKVQLPAPDVPQHQNTTPTAKEKPVLFNWKSFQEKAKQRGPDAYDFTVKTQKQLAQGDMNMRNAMIKKLFYKRNPFSPRNLIVRTLLGKDPSSFGNPPKMYRPRMFL